MPDPEKPEPIATVDARKAVNLPDNPRITPTVDAAKPDAPAAPPVVGLKDNTGAPFDPTRHMRDKNGNPAIAASGRWMRIRGNGARRAMGKPPSGYLAGPKGAPAAPPSSASASSAPPSPGEAGVIVDGEPSPEPAPALLENDYEGTAIGLTNGGFSLMQLAFGPAWEPDADERKTWVGALRRLWFHYQLPRFGPLLEVVVLIPATIAKRRTDARTLEGWAKIKVWCGLKSKDKPKPDDTAGGAQKAA